VTLFGLSLLVTAPVAAEELVFKDSTGYCAEIDGADASDARFFVTVPPGRVLVDLPSLSANVLILPKAKKVVKLPPSTLQREVDPSSLGREDDGESVPRYVAQLPPDVPDSPMSVTGGAWSFPVGDAEVRILKASDCQANVAPVIPVAGVALVLRACDTYCAEINGAYAPDARFFSTDPKGRLLVDLPSLSTSALLALKAQKLVTLPRSSFKLEADGSKARLVDQVSPEAPVSSLSMGGPAWSFKINDSEVRILKASGCHPVVATFPPNEPVTDDLKAKKCLHQETRSVRTSDCTSVTSLRNSCDVAVVVVVQTTQHLFSGTLPQTSTVVIPPGAVYPLGCVWSSGAMGPTNYDILAAAFASHQPTRH
jgi:hypothetical protein